MSKRTRLGISAFLLAALCGFTARANTISIPNGVITSGFATGGGGYFSGNVFGPGFGIFVGSSYPWLQEFSAPGSYPFVDNGSNYFGYGGGYVNPGGTYYECGSTVPPDFSDCNAGIEIGGTITLPDYGPSPPTYIVLTFPFTALAGVSYDPRFEYCANGCFFVNATGQGIATVTLGYHGNSTYVVQSAEYNFFAVPEPATMTLAGLGLLAVILLRRRAANAAGRTSRTGRETHCPGHRSV
jgi:PEP-CTERM motif